MFTKTKKLSLFVVFSSILGGCSQLPTNIPVYNLNNNTQNSGLKPTTSVVQNTNITTNTTTDNNSSFGSPTFIIPTVQGNTIDSSTQVKYNNSNYNYNSSNNNTQANNQTVTIPTTTNNNVDSCNTIHAYVVNIPKFPNGKPDYSQIQKGSYHADNYLVQKGDTLYLISYLTGRSISDLTKFNNISSNMGLIPGQTIIVNPINCNKTISSSEVLNNPSNNINQKVQQRFGSSTEVPSVSKVTTSTINTIDNTESKVNSVVNNASSKIVDIVTKPKVTKVESNVVNSVNDITDKIKNYTTTLSNNATNEVTDITNTESNKINDTISGPNGSNTSSNALYWPANGRVISSYSSSAKGIEITGNNGDKVSAAASGTVSYAGQFQGYGNIILIKNSNDMITLYAHNSKLLVQTGQKVKRGQTIALMGSTGTTKTELYFEVRIHGKTVDPLKYLPPR